MVGNTNSTFFGSFGSPIVENSQEETNTSSYYRKVSSITGDIVSPLVSFSAAVVAVSLVVVAMLLALVVMLMLLLLLLL